MPYVVPRVRVFQEFRTVPGGLVEPLRAFIIGPHGQLHRYRIASEKAAINLGAYDPENDADYDWPSKVAGSKIDAGYTKLFIEDALLRYFIDSVGVADTIAPVASYRNKIRAAATVWKTENDEDRSAALLERDVTVGDRVYVRGVAGGETYELNSYVRGFEAEVVAATVDDAAAESSNADAQGFATSIDFIAGPKNNITYEVDGSSYDGREDGDIDEYYTIECIQGSINEDHTTAILRVTSASGNDNDSSVTPEAVGNWTAIGTRGLLLKMNLNETASGSSAAANDDAAPNDLVAGQKIRIHVTQAFIPATAESAGTYTGEQNTTYIVEVTKGGAWADSPEVTITTNNGYDVSGPTVVSGAGNAFAVGNYGVTCQFSGSGLNKGDSYDIAVTAEGEGAIQTLVMAHQLPSEIADVEDLHVELYIRKNYEITENRTGFAPEVNWEQTQTEFTTKSAIVGYDSTWVDDAGDQQALDLVGGTLYLEYREWLTRLVGELASLNDSADVTGEIGTTHPDNPLAYGVFKALANSNGTDVYYTAIADPSNIDNWQTALDEVADRGDNIYNLVPLSTDAAVLSALRAHIVSQSSENKGRWRASFFPMVAVETKLLCSAANSSDEAAILATLGDDPENSDTQYTLLEVTSNNIEFIDEGVRVGDTVRFLYSTDGWSDETYTSFTVSEVRSQTQLVFESGHTSAVTTPRKIEVWRNQRKSEIASALATKAGSYGSTRVCAVWPDVFEADGLEDVPGYFLCCILAGLRSGVVPHQPLTNVQLGGIDSVNRTTEFFAESHLDTLAESGTWIVTQDRNGRIFTRHALTSNVETLMKREEMIRVNVDSMSYIFHAAMKPFIGRANVTPSAIRSVATTLRSVVEYLKSRSFTESLGSQLIEGTIDKVRRSQLEADKLEAFITLRVPAPMNFIDVHLVI